MTEQSFEEVKIRCAPNGKFNVRKQGETICLPNGSLRYFATQDKAWAFLAHSDVEIDNFAAA